MRDKAFTIANNPKYDGYQRELASMVYKFFDKNPLRLINLMEVVSLMNQIINWKMSSIIQLLEKFQKEKFIHFLKTIFGVLI